MVDHRCMYNVGIWMENLKICFFFINKEVPKFQNLTQSLTLINMALGPSNDGRSNDRLSDEYVLTMDGLTIGRSDDRTF